MSLHDQIAQKVRADGNTSAEFRAAAQRHANATWGYLLIAGIVWYFASWPWALIPGVLALYVAKQSMGASAVATRLEQLERSEGGLP